MATREQRAGELLDLLGHVLDLADFLQEVSAGLLDTAERLRELVEQLQLPTEPTIPPDRRIFPGAVVDLPVPYFSQWDEPGVTGGEKVDADRSPGDCGPAALTMLIHYFTIHEPTVDEVAVAAGQPAGGYRTSMPQLIEAGRKYGLALQWVRPLTLARIREELDAGRPVLALVHYEALPGRQDSFRGGHFVDVVGYGSDDAGEFFLLNDPDWRGMRREEGDHWRVAAEDLDRALAQTPRDGNKAYQGLVAFVED